jgi:tryptophan 7-halogenase
MINSIAVLGNDLAAWMACAAISSELQNTPAKIVMLTGVGDTKDDEIQSPLPGFIEFLDLLKIPDEEMFELCAALPQLGNAYHFNGESFYHIWGEYGAGKGVIPFHQLLIRVLVEGKKINLNELSIAATAASVNRYTTPVNDKKSIRSTYEASFSFSTEKFIRVLKKKCMAHGVILENKLVRDVSQSNNSVFIEMSDGEQLVTDYLLNTSAKFVSWNNKQENWSDYLVYGVKETKAQAASANKLTADVFQDVKNEWRISRYANDLSETQYFSLGMDNPPFYCLLYPRDKRILNLGAAAIYMKSPLFCDADLIWAAISQMLQYFPHPDESNFAIEEFNDRLVDAYSNLRDITQIVIGLMVQKINPSKKTTSEKMSDKAKHKKNLFCQRGKIPLYENEVYKMEWQVWLLLGLGVVPRNIDPMALMIEPEEIMHMISAIKKAVTRELLLIPKLS